MNDMNRNYNSEEQEYNQYMAKLFKKACEVSDDFSKLSPVNQQRVNNALKQYVNLEAVLQFIRNLSQ